MSESSVTSPITVVALVRDLMFVGRLTAEARAAGVPIKIIRDPAMLNSDTQLSLLLVDLNLPGAIESAGKYKSRSAATPIIGFVAHTDTATIDSARAAGIDRVLARSAFVVQLPSLLKSLIA